MSIDPSQLKAQAEEQMTQEKQLAEAKKRRNIALTGLLTPEARERLDRLALVYPHKADAVTDLILQRADSGFVSQRVNEDQLKRMLDEVSMAKQSSSSVKFQRKAYRGDDDDDDDDDDL